jgi:hypothetical protein
MPGPEEFFFEIPIYRCSEDEHNTQWQHEIDRLMQSVKPYKDRNPEGYKERLEYVRQLTWRQWRYAEVVGWIRLHRLDTQIRGELWFSTAKRIVRGCKAPIRWQGKAFERTCWPSETDEEIGCAIMAQLKTFAASGGFRRRYIDLECFTAIYDKIGWRRLLRFQ